MTISPNDIKNIRIEEVQPVIDLIGRLLIEKYDGQGRVIIEIGELIDGLQEWGLDPYSDPYNISYLRPLTRRVFFSIRRVFEMQGWEVGGGMKCDRDENGDVIFDDWGDACNVERNYIWFKSRD